MVPDLQGQGDQGPEACVRPRGSGRPGDGHTGNADSAPLPQDAAVGSRPGLSPEVAGTARGGAPGEVWRMTAARPVKEPLQRAESLAAVFGSRFRLRHRCASGRQDRGPGTRTGPSAAELGVCAELPLPCPALPHGISREEGRACGEVRTCVRSPPTTLPSHSSGKPRQGSVPRPPPPESPSSPPSPFLLGSGRDLPPAHAAQRQGRSLRFDQTPDLVSRDTGTGPGPDLRTARFLKETVTARVRKRTWLRARGSSQAPAGGRSAEKGSWGGGGRPPL